MPTGRFKSVCPICTERELEVGSQGGSLRGSEEAEASELRCSLNAS